jgi:subtilisin family serine protease
LRCGEAACDQPAFIEVANRATLEWLKTRPWIGSDFVQIVDGYCSATVDFDHLDELEAHPGVVEVEANRFLKAQLNQSLAAIHAVEPRRERRPSSSGKSGEDPIAHERGAGVVIGIVDYGIDFTLADFMHEGKKNRTRIAFLWDQQIHPVRPGETSPEKYRYGVEYTAEDLDRALSSPDPFSVVRHSPTDAASDVSGHGTHVAGIAAGNGTTSDKQFPAKHYVGVAPEATIVFVHLNRSAIVGQVEGEGTLASSVQLAHAIAYCFEKAEELGKPCVVNLSMGFNGGGHDGDSAVEWIIDALLERPGRAVVAAAGNEDTHRIHYSDDLSNSPVTIRWQHGIVFPGVFGLTLVNDPSPNEMEIWYSRKNKVEAWVTSPDGERKGPVGLGGSRRTYRFANGESVVIVSDRHTPWNGDARIRISISGSPETGIRFGTWEVGLRAVEISERDGAGRAPFHAWIERTTPIDAPQHWRSSFLDASPNASVTITTPATSRRVIAVANYVLGPEDSKWPADSSGRGPTRDGRRKPELAAPGQYIFSSRAGAGRGKPRAAARQQMAGTSMSAPHVAGVVARLLGVQNYLTCDEIRDLLVSSADPVPDEQGAVTPETSSLPIHDIDAAYKDRKWHPKWGYGMLNAANAMKRLRAHFRT